MFRTNKNLTTFVERLYNGIIKHYKIPNCENEFSDYQEKLSLINFEEYLYSLRHINDFKIHREYFG